MNFTLPRWAHIVLYLASVAIVAVVHLASNGNLAISAPIAAVLTTLLTTINSVDPETVAKTLPAATLARLADAKKLAASEAPTK